MMYHAITASTLLVLQVINLLFNAVNLHCNLPIKNSGLPRIIVRAQTGSMVNFQNNLLQTSPVNIIHAFDDHLIAFEI